MTCPLSALAEIASMTADCRPAVRRVDATSSPAPSCALSAAAPASTAPRPAAHKKKGNVPPKKRSVSAANLESPNHGHSNTTTTPAMPGPSMSAAALASSPLLRGSKSNKKARTGMTSAAPSVSETSAVANATFEMKANDPPFPLILMAIMSAPQNEEFISFLSDGQSFVIVRPQALAKYVLPLHFKEGAPTLDQFLCLLAVWGFEAVNFPNHPELKVFNHPMFRKGDWEACLRMDMPRNGGIITPPNQAAASPPTEPVHAHLGHSGRQQSQPASPLRKHSFIDGSAEPQPSRTAARSVTPPQNIASSHFGMLQHHAAAAAAAAVAAAAPFMTQNSSPTSQWIFQSAMLEQMIMATAETRRRLSGFRAASVASPSVEEYPNVDAASAMPTAMCSIPTASFAPVETKLNHAQVQLVTNDIVSAAMAALDVTNERPLPRHEPGCIMVTSPAASSLRLDAMTEAFIERSNARTMQSRPAGILGSSSSTRALLARQQ